MLPRLLSTLQVLMEEVNDTDYLPFLYSKLHFQLERPYDSERQKLWMIRGEIAKLTKELLSLYLPLSLPL